jgi:acetyl esterase
VNLLPLDPDVKKKLESSRLDPVENLSEIDINKIRRIMNQGIISETKERVKDVRDIELSSSERNITGRLYIPEKSGDSLIIYFHGGWYVYGNIDTHDEVCRKAANCSGSMVLSVNYRLAPEYKFPAQLDDGIESLLWVQKNHRSLGINPNKIAVAGDSSGGNLAASLCLKARDMDMKLPALQVLIYPFLFVLDTSESMREYSQGFSPSLNPDMGSFFVKCQLNDVSDILNPYYSVFLGDIQGRNLSGLPEAIILTAEYDSVRDQAESYLSKLRKAGVKATGIRTLGMTHGFARYSGEVLAAENIMIMVWSLVGNILNKRNV